MDDMTIAAAGVRGPYRNGIERRRQIVETAWRVFARRGYANASLREIALEVGVTPAALSRHFPSKEDLLIAVLDHWSDETQNLSDDVSQGEGLRWFLSFPRLMRFHVEHPGLIELFLTLCTEASDPDHAARAWVSERYARIVVQGAEHLAAAEREGHVRPMTPAERELELRTLFAIMDGLELQWISDPAFDLVGQFEATFAHILTRWTGLPCTIVRGDPRFGERTVDERTVDERTGETGGTAETSG
jgi:AcrR family transcriptional regulator